MKKTIKLLSIFQLIIALIVFVGCSSDDDGDNEPAVDNLVGVWNIKSTTLLNNLEAGGVVYLENPDGTDITPVMKAALLESSPCDTDAVTRIELTEDGILRYVCTDSDETLQNGTWSIDEERIRLTMTINIPSSPVPVPLTMFELVETPTSISGTVQSLPLPATTFQGLINLEEVPAGTVFPSRVTLEFTKD